MLTTKDLIEALSKYPDGAEWEVVGDRCIASELGVIDLEAMVGNDLGSATTGSDVKASQDMSGEEFIKIMKESSRKFHEAAAPLVEKLCESYDTDRVITLEGEFIESDKKQQADIFREAGKL